MGQGVEVHLSEQLLFFFDLQHVLFFLWQRLLVEKQAGGGRTQLPQPQQWFLQVSCEKRAKG